MMEPRTTRALIFALLVSLLPLAGCGRAADETSVLEEASGRPEEFSVVTYNVENLFDADGLAVFEDYVESDADHSYSPRHILNKLRGISDVLKTFGDGQGPEVIAFSEIEIDFSPDSKVTDYAAFLQKYEGTTVEKMLTTELNDEIRGLPAEALLLKHLADEGMTGYVVAIGQDEPDLQALSNGSASRRKAQKNVLFSKFPIASQRSHPTEDARDILEAELSIEGHSFYVFVNHWKSGASSTESEQTRRANARTLRERVGQIFSDDPSADILLAGDFNSHHNQSQRYPRMAPTGLNDILGSQGREAASAAATEFSLYNLWYELPLTERRSDHHQGLWGTLMQKMITPGLYDYNGIQYVDNSFEVVLVDGVNVHTALRLPRRWSNAGEGSGTSDHFPVAARFRVVTEGDKVRRWELANPKRDDASSEALRVGYETLKPGRLAAFTGHVAQNPSNHVGDFFLVKGRISRQKPLTVEVAGDNFLLWSHDFDLRREMQRFPVETEIEFIGQLGLHRGKWQLVVEQPAWLLKRSG